MQLKLIIEVISIQRLSWIMFLLLASLLIVGCEKRNSTVLMYTQKGDIKIEVDSVIRWPELAHFPIRVRVTNYSDKKVALVFDPISNVSKDQVKNLLLIRGTDTFYLGIRMSGMPLILNENTITSFNCLGYFHFGKGHFDSFKEIESGFKEGKLFYRLGKKSINQSHLEKLHIEADTILLPTLLEARTDKALLVNEF